MNYTIKENNNISEIIKEKEVIKYIDTTDKEYSSLSWLVYGNIPNNEIIVCVSNNKKVFWASCPSAIEFPAMKDRIFGLDIADSELASQISNYIWSKKQEELINK